jgi:hypothetical protein
MAQLRRRTPLLALTTAQTVRKENALTRGFCRAFRFGKAAVLRLLC